jgi:chloramphenicol-sensitive protein RarD
LNPGVVYAALAFIWWGLFPLYFRIVSAVPPTEILAHRIVWSLVFLLGLLAFRRQWAWLGQVLRQPKVLAAFTASALLLAGNWLTYLWAVNNGHLIDASLGYFINPLVNVLLGYTVLHERPRRAQWIALSLAGLGVVWLTIAAGKPPWIALVLASTFGAYGLLRKVAVLGPLEGLALETILLSPLAVLALAVLAWQGSASFPTDSAVTNLWLMGFGPITAAPLLLFAAGARRLPLMTLGLLQYLGPTLQFAIGIWIFREPFTATRGIGFGLIWLALLLYSFDGWQRARVGSSRPAGATTS